jgi:hypothetical protein
MNELIKKLANESGYYLYDLTETHGIKTVETDSKDEWITLEKFAELIVQECADIASQEDFDVMMKEGYPCSHTAEKIKKHFGVEE